MVILVSVCLFKNSKADTSSLDFRSLGKAAEVCRGVSILDVRAALRSHRLGDVGTTTSTSSVPQARCPRSRLQKIRGIPLWFPDADFSPCPHVVQGQGPAGVSAARAPLPHHAGATLLPSSPAQPRWGAGSTRELVRTQLFLVQSSRTNISLTEFVCPKQNLAGRKDIYFIGT